MSNELMGTQEIANLLGITRAWAVGNIIKRPDFPSPAINLSQRIRKWRRSDVVKWVQKPSKS
jgi:predicted DNA-binding transcriptional regulator AlpA